MLEIKLERAVKHVHTCSNQGTAEDPHQRLHGAQRGPGRAGQAQPRGDGHCRQDGARRRGVLPGQTRWQF